MKPEEFIFNKKNEVKNEIGNNEIITAVSGGVDSLTAALLVNTVAKDKMTCILIDTGFMRKNEIKEISLEMRKIDLKVDIIDASKEFISDLENVDDAEDKRKIFRERFYNVLSEKARKLNAKFLVQGTIAPDWIETVGKIKTQHNILKQIGIDPESKYGMKVIEPLSELYKDEVREIAKFLGVSKKLFSRQPFPGPGLLVRIIGRITVEKLCIEREIDDIVTSVFRERNYSQYFAAIFEKKISNNDKVKLSLQKILGNDAKFWIAESRVTGVKGDTRNYGLSVFLERPTLENLNFDQAKKIALHVTQLDEVSRFLVKINCTEANELNVAVVRAVITEDFMTASIPSVDLNDLYQISKRIEMVEGVNESYFDFTSKPPGTIEFE